MSAFDGDISGMLDKLNGMLDASKEYKNFAGISDGMDGEVKFVFVTENNRKTQAGCPGNHS